jgi:hypothetical protein
MRLRNDAIAQCVVWTPIPVLSGLCPAIGHVGVTDSQGTTYDFEGPFLIGKGQMIFGDPRQKWKIPVDSEIWDAAIAEVSNEFASVNYNLLCSNCHYFAASVLDRVGYEVIRPFGGHWVNGATVKIIWGLICHGRSLSIKDIIVIWLPFLILVCIFLRLKL